MFYILYFFILPLTHIHHNIYKDMTGPKWSTLRVHLRVPRLLQLIEYPWLTCLLIYPRLRTSSWAVAENYIFNMLTVMATVNPTPTQKPQ